MTERGGESIRLPGVPLMTDKLTTYSAFWPHYLREHARPATRALHFAGTACGLVLLIAAGVTGLAWLVLPAVVSGYAFAWLAHLLIEKNRPATFTYPLWSLISDFRMFFLWLTGRLGPELRKAGVDG
jgi:hypothetical protein